jgi:hypothetical protein
MRIGPAPLFPLNPLQPDRTEPYPKALGASFVGKPYLTFPEVKVQPSEALQARAKELSEARTEGTRESQSPEPVKPRGALAQLPEPRSTADPSGPLGARIDLLA